METVGQTPPGPAWLAPSTGPARISVFSWQMLHMTKSKFGLQTWDRWALTYELELTNMDFIPCHICSEKTTVRKGKSPLI